MPDRRRPTGFLVRAVRRVSWGEQTGDFTLKIGDSEYELFLGSLWAQDFRIFDKRRPREYWKSGNFNRDCDSRIFKGLLRGSLAGDLYWESRNSNTKALGVLRIKETPMRRVAALAMSGFWTPAGSQYKPPASDPRSTPLKILESQSLLNFADF